MIALLVLMIPTVYLVTCLGGQMYRRICVTANPHDARMPKTPGASTFGPPKCLTHDRNGDAPHKIFCILPINCC